MATWLFSSYDVMVPRRVAYFLIVIKRRLQNIAYRRVQEVQDDRKQCLY